jgi:hypothetical protein
MGTRPCRDRVKPAASWGPTQENAFSCSSSRLAQRALNKSMNKDLRGWAASGSFNDVGSPRAGMEREGAPYGPCT